MARAIVALCVSGGGIALGVWVDRLNAPMWVLALAWILPFTLAAVIAWWPRWKSAWSAFWSLNENERQTGFGIEHVVISNRTFRHEVVDVDDRTFDHCQFIGVTMFYRGVGSYTFLECRFEGNTVLKSDNKAAHGFVALLEFLKKQPGVQGVSNAALVDALP